VSEVEVWDDNIIYTSPDNLDYITEEEYQDIINDFSLGDEEMLFILNMKRLTERQKKCFLLYYFKHFTQCEVAKNLGINQRTVSYHLSRAKEKILKVLGNKIDYIKVEDAEQLSLEERAVLKLYFIDGLTQKEVAKLVGVSQPAIHKKLRKASRKYGESV
jgi:DNA-directed RNA polymerase specialized sigma24 family protein